MRRSRSWLHGRMVCGVFRLQVPWAWFSQCQSAANGGVGGGLLFCPASFSLFEMVAFKFSLGWPPQHKISTCKPNEDSYICSPFNCFNRPAASNIQRPPKIPRWENWSVVIWACIWFLFPSVRWKSLLAHAGILYLASDIKVRALNVCCPTKHGSLRGGWWHQTFRGEEFWNSGHSMLRSYSRECSWRSIAPFCSSRKTRFSQSIFRLNPSVTSKLSWKPRTSFPS